MRRYPPDTRHPLVHSITNYVVMSYTANALFAMGAASVMGHVVNEVENMAGIAGALVVNIGTPEIATARVARPQSRFRIVRTVPITQLLCTQHT